MAIPVIVAAGVFEIRHLGYAEIFQWSFALGIATSFVSALFAIRFLLGYVKTRSFTLFVIYRAILSVVIIAVYLWA